MTPAGRLTRRLRFESPAPVQDGLGNVEAGWHPQFTVAAEVFARSGGEQVLAARLSGVQPVEITVRLSSATARISAAWRAVDVRTGEVFALVSPPFDLDGKRAFHKMLGQSRAAR